MKFSVQQGDALETLRTLPAESFDACLSDPPYGLSFMGKAWDRGVPNVEVWKEIRRVLKPGAFLLAFGGSRTHHRLMCAIEDAGFEIRDCCMWLYGSGFPKSLDIGKAIDKAAGVERETIRHSPRPLSSGTMSGKADTRPWIDESRRVGYHEHAGPIPASDAARTWNGYGTALKPAWEPIIVAMKPCDGTFAENALKHGVAGLNIDAGRIGTDGGCIDAGLRVPGVMVNCFGAALNGRRFIPVDGMGRWPANVILDEEAGAILDEQSGELQAGNFPAVRNVSHFATRIQGATTSGHVAMNSGGASRFFYTAKASPSERNANLQGRNQHPTVKPVDLNRYLASLILPPDRDTPRRLLVPFSGSGSEILGAIAAGWDECLGIESDPQWVAVARERIEESAPLFLRPQPQVPVQEERPEPTLFDVTEWTPESTALAPIETGETAGNQPLKILESVPSEAD